MLGVGCFRCFVFGFGVGWLLGFLIVWLFGFGVLGLGVVQVWVLVGCGNRISGVLRTFGDFVLLAVWWVAVFWVCGAIWLRCFGFVGLTF